MKRLQLLIGVTLIALCACNQTPQFNPQEKDDGLSDAEREQLIAQKRAEYNSGNGDFSEIVKFDGKVKLTIMVPDIEGASESDLKIIESKLIQMATFNGIGGIGANPRYVLAPDVTVLQKEATTTAPVKYMMKYDVTFYVADIITGTIFASENTQINGVGESERRALLNAFNSINPKDSKYQRFIGDAQEKLITYYQTNGGKIIQEADMLASQGHYAQALAIISSIPTEADKFYGTAVKKSNEYFKKYLDNECETALAMMKSSMANEQNEEAMAYYAMIPAGGKCKAEAEKCYKEHKANMAAEKKHQWEKEEKEWNAKMKQQDADNALRSQEAELKARVEISGSKCLLDKYKKDASYNKLPWIRKVIHLGDIDPFDGYRPEKGC